ncbi:hypothetical protein QBC33DRAFT_557284 [Phialemonium atrogriseum]|uniref:Uncharacterized protein n=1 Tax=Phialemonium atrogriseum TaxID=1093897 RepID=A0AAJ0C5S8_9PEZI|nr:uncharacterized protein QBC33DRAFT_557284 [Phialemonium atrogriseum]KAK1769234.1 hypothetical protein QBC33DRAFT_557284 [Phialemonium atrogriseum]
MFDLTKCNLSYYSVPAAFVLLVLPHAYAVRAAGRNYDLAQPRRTDENLAKDESLDKVTVRRIQRARAAAANGLETIGLYAAAIVAANTQGVPTRKLNLLSLGYLASRVVYNFVYVVVQDNRKTAAARPLTWGAGIAVIMSLFLSAARNSN